MTLQIKSRCPDMTDADAELILAIVVERREQLAKIEATIGNAALAEKFEVPEAEIKKLISRYGNYL